MNNTSPTEDLFAFKLNYNKVDDDLGGIIKPLYNGNISETFWTTADNIKRKYGYAYDNLNRLNDAIYQNLDAGNYDSYNEKIRYDKNGNIKKLQRNGYLDGHTPYQIDDLEYNYSVLQPNTLDAVNDLSNSFDGFKDSNQLNKDYFYDTNGNMTHDSNKDIDIRYNHLNLPTHIAFNSTSNQGDITYTYNAVGAKVSKLVTQSSTQSQILTEYLAGGFQYIDSRLEFFPTPEGYVNVTEDQLYNYVYNYSDHLGNLRLSYTFDQELQELAVLQENHYYPFGMKHSNYGVSETDYLHDEITGQIYAVIEPVASNKFKYKYNGKEFQDELNLNWYDYHARNYDSALGRWMNIDPLAETSRRFSPYTYCLNNPLRFIDPDGMMADDTLGDLDDEFLVSPNGNIKQVAKEGEHVVVMLDNDGNRTGVTQNIGNEATLKEFSIGDTDVQILEIGDQEKAKDAFKTISASSEVEHALINYDDISGASKSAIVNNGEPDNVVGSTVANAMYDKGGNTVTEINHNHPNSSPPSGYLADTGEVLNYPLGDNRNATQNPTNNKGEPIKRGVYRPAIQKINQYDANKFYPAEDY